MRKGESRGQGMVRRVVERLLWNGLWEVRGTFRRRKGILIIPVLFENPAQVLPFLRKAASSVPSQPPHQHLPYTPPLGICQGRYCVCGIFVLPSVLVKL